MAEMKNVVVYPPNVTPDSESPPVFDGTTRLYLSYVCPFARRAWIAVNYKGLHDQIQFVPMDLKNRPVWYKEKVYPANKVPSFEHNNKVTGESLDVVKYIDANFEGPRLLPEDPEKLHFAEEMVAYSDNFVKVVFGSFASKGDPETEVGPALNHLENSLGKFEDGPFFIGQFSIADIAFVTFVEKAQAVLLETKNYDITAGRPKLAKWIQDMHQVEAYTVTKTAPHT